MSAAAPVVSIRELPPDPEFLPDEDLCNSVIQYTQQMFPGGKVALRNERDPELGDRYTIVSVAYRGTEDELNRLDRLWHENLGDAAPGRELYFGLLIFPR